MVYSKFRKFIVGKDFSKGFISGSVRKKAEDLTSQFFTADSDLSFLYVGCGEGLYLISNAKKYLSSKHTGIDNWREVLEYTRKRVLIENLTNTELNLAEGDQLPYNSGQFDCVYFLNAMLNQKDSKTVISIISEMLRVTKQGGRVIFDFRNSKSIVSKLIYSVSGKMDQTKPVINLHESNFFERVIDDLGDFKIQVIPVGLLKISSLVVIEK